MKFSLHRLVLIALVAATFSAIAGCGDDTPNENGTTPTDTGQTTAPPVVAPDFSEDSAYAFIEKQISFGPRVPNTKAHTDCANWLAEKFRSYGCTVQIQETKLTAYDGTVFNMKNIIASVNPGKTPRLLITSHWDSRPMADKDKTNPTAPVPAANDGASGVGVILELARILRDKPATVGVDFILWDCEDYGNYDIPESWALGSAYWSKHKHDPNYTARFGINLDMVGAEGAIFFHEGHTMQYAKAYGYQVWSVAQSLGFGNYFQNLVENQGVLDDHVNVILNAGIPMVEIIHRDPATGAFFPEWHTTKDDMSRISKPTLNAVGTTVAAVIYQEK